MSEALARVKKVRAGHRSSTTRLMHQLAGEYEIDDGPLLERLMQCKVSLNEKLDRLRTLDEEILALVNDDDIESEIEQADQFKERVHQAIFHVQHRISAKQFNTAPPYVDSTHSATSPAPDTATVTSSDTTVIPTEVIPPIVTTTEVIPPTVIVADVTPPTSHTSDTSSATTVVTSTTVTPVIHHEVSETRVKLPKIEPKRFNGDLTKWETFWSSFELAIHHNSTLTAVDKFQYLSSLLEGPAIAAIAGLKMTAPNYIEAIDILTKRFGNKSLIIARHMDTLLELEPVTSPNNIKALRRLFDKVEFQVRSLRSLDVPLDSYGNLLSSLFMSRLPQEFRLLVSREIGEDEWRIDQITNIVGREISARERAFTQTGSQAHGSGPVVPTITAMTTGDGKPRCCYCRQSHPSVSCRTITDITQRKTILKKSGRCFVCLKRHHMSRDCRSTIPCSLCNGRHHTSLCKGRDGRSQSAGNQVQPVTTTTQPSNIATNHPPVMPEPRTTPATTTGLYCVNADVPVLLQTAQAYIYNPNDPACGMTIRLMFDGGSQRSYVTERVKEVLGLMTTCTEEVNIRTFGSQTTRTQTVDLVTAVIMPKEGGHINVLFSTVPLICEPLSCQPVAYTKQRYSHLANLELADSSTIGDELQIDALIGADHYWQLVSGQIIQGCSGPTAIQTRLGWVLSGPVCSGTELNKLKSSYAMLIQSSDTPCLDNLLKNFWQLESLGINPDEPSVYDEFKKSIKFVGGRYEVSLPWRSNHTQLPSNLHLATKRLQGLLKRLRQHPDLRREYHAIMQEQLRQGIIEKVSPCQTANIIHYLPHHAVIRNDKPTTKLRIVYDASARDKGLSLNDCLFSGPKFDQSIIDILIRFRTYQVAFAADVEKAFLMVSVCEEDRDALRFLWVDSVEKSPPDIQEMRFARVVFGVSSSPFLLNATISHHLGKYRDRYPDVVQTLLRSIYVDDVTCGANTEDDAYQLYSISTKLFSEGGFNLRKFLTNSVLLSQRMRQQTGCPNPAVTTSNVVEENTTYTSTLFNNERSDHQKILGVAWNPTSDELVFDMRGMACDLQTLEPTKRNIVGFSSRFYDPLGILSPVTITLKIFFQELCKVKVNWDEPLPSELLCKWQCLVSNFQGVVLSIPRCYFPLSSIRDCLLYGFCDASQSAYAAVIYLYNGSDSVQFVASKTRVAPLVQATIPRLELLSCLLLARLMAHVEEALKPVVKVQLGLCFTDSKVALYWVQGECKDWKPFVHNRVTEIRQLVPAVKWSHCPGKDNPADLPSRGISPRELESNQAWLHGPQWLPKMSLNQQITVTDMPEECAVELKRNKHPTSHSLLVSQSIPAIGAVIDCKRFSRLQRLLRVTVFVQKFVLCFKSLTGHDCTVDWAITAQDIDKAEMAWVADCQQHLTKDPKFGLWKCQLQLFCDQQDVWRCGGRLAKADVTYSKKHPILLPKQHHFATLVTENAHERTGHGGVKSTLTEIRSKYWFVRGRQFVRKILYRCVTCRKFEGPHYQAVTPPPLPEYRVKEAPPFAYSGVDFAGPLYIKVLDGSEHSKVWIVLYTCCVTRAVHLELVPDMTAQTFLRSFKRFTSRRGVPVQMVSDNGKTFISAAHIIDDVLTSPEVQQHFAGMKITWIFNLEKAPWWGGFFERMIQSMKRCLKKAIGKAKLTYDEMLTVLTEVEAIINSRPLSYFSSEDIEEPLTPSHLLSGHRVLGLPDSSVTVGNHSDVDFTVDQQDLHTRVSNLKQALSEFWERWHNEYLLQLRERYTHTDTGGVPRSPIPGEVVLIHQENQPRALWRLGRVKDVITGSDGQIRGAILTIVTNGKQSALRRPISCLYPLEINPEANPQKKSPDVESTVADESQEADGHVRPVRAAAVKARQCVSNWIADITNSI